MLSISKFRVPLLLSLLSHGQAAALADHPRRVNTGGERWFSRGAEECVAQVVGPEAREQICRVANAVRVLAALFLAIHPPVRVSNSHPTVQIAVPVTALARHPFEPISSVIPV